MRKIKFAFLVLPVIFLAQSCVFNPLGSVAADASGILKSQDSGEAWEKASSLGESGSLGKTSIARLTLDREQTQTLYASSPASGVFKTEDGAKTWKSVLSKTRIYDTQINPKNSKEIMAAGAAGTQAKVFKSSDGGQTWVESYSEAKQNSFVSALAYSPQNERIIFIGLSSGEVITSINGGVSWDLISKLTGRILKIHFVTNDGRQLYALSMEQGLFQSTDSGMTWKQISSSIKTSKFYEFIFNQNVILLGTNAGLYRSVNAGTAWEKLSLPLSEGSATTVSAVAVSPKNSNELYAVVAQTMYKSTDGGTSWQTRTLPSSASVRNLVIDPKQTNIIYAALGEVLQ